ncbi:ParA family protein [Intestinibacter bartlettii]|jgi:chromosome partitioning protein|uniref:ParA-like protein n=1 Tax=human gut metagenome TaxID=408170 RepID=W1WGK6_9ZZZZ|nr:AAA family ATPase [Intestinibacter bartlettii]MDU1254372.1 AAA family ATPase [Peptostreptococcaceae bacterium]MDU2693937.1 AAA family ATPase [Intestinibacter bartlettii]MDU6210061.1 AAA family ATPase [Clostridium perfringens]
MKIVSFFNVKGGVGKTTLTILTAITLSKEGKKVLIIDADTQANLTQFMYKVSHNDKTLFDGLINSLSADQLILKSPVEKYPNIDLIPSDLSLSVLSEYLTTKTNREKSVWRWFKNNIDIIKEYDYIFVDLSPSYDLIARNFMIISDSIITPIAYQDIASIRGCELFYQKFNEDLNDMEMENDAKRAVLINSFTSRKLSTGDIFMEKLEEYPYIKNDLLDSKLSDTTLIKNAILNKLDIEDYCKKNKKPHKVREEFKDVINELKQKGVL